MKMKAVTDPLNFFTASLELFTLDLKREHDLTPQRLIRRHFSIRGVLIELRLSNPARRLAEDGIGIGSMADGMMGSS
jgi:hypothetical protein